MVQGWDLTTYRGERLGCVLTPSELFRMDPLNPKPSGASANVTAETLRPEQEAERLNDRGR